MAQRISEKNATPKHDEDDDKIIPDSTILKTIKSLADNGNGTLDRPLDVLGEKFYSLQDLAISLDGWYKDIPANQYEMIVNEIGNQFSSRYEQEKNTADRYIDMFYQLIRNREPHFHQYRLTSGFSAGWGQLEAIRKDHRDRKKRVEKSVESIKKLWTENSITQGWITYRSDPPSQNWASALLQVARMYDPATAQRVLNRQAYNRQRDFLQYRVSISGNQLDRGRVTTAAPATCDLINIHQSDHNRDDRPLTNAEMNEVNMYIDANGFGAHRKSPRPGRKKIKPVGPSELGHRLPITPTSSLANRRGIQASLETESATHHAEQLHNGSNAAESPASVQSSTASICRQPLSNSGIANDNLTGNAAQPAEHSVQNGNNSRTSATPALADSSSQSPPNLRNRASLPPDCFQPQRLRLPRPEEIDFDAIITDLATRLNLPATFKADFDTHGMMDIPEAFTHLLVQKTLPEQDDSLVDLALKEADMYRHHTVGCSPVLWTMQYSVVQQVLERDLLLYLLNVCLRPDHPIRLMAFPQPAVFVDTPRGAPSTEFFSHDLGPHTRLDNALTCQVAFLPESIVNCHEYLTSAGGPLQGVQFYLDYSDFLEATGRPALHDTLSHTLDISDFLDHIQGTPSTKYTAEKVPLPGPGGARMVRPSMPMRIHANGPRLIYSPTLVAVQEYLDENGTPRYLAENGESPEDIANYHNKQQSSFRGPWGAYQPYRCVPPFPPQLSLHGMSPLCDALIGAVSFDHPLVILEMRTLLGPDRNAAWKLIRRHQELARLRAFNALQTIFVVERLSYPTDGLTSRSIPNPGDDWRVARAKKDAKCRQSPSPDIEDESSSDHDSDDDTVTQSEDGLMSDDYVEFKYEDSDDAETEQSRKRVFVYRGEAGANQPKRTRTGVQTSARS